MAFVDWYTIGKVLLIATIYVLEKLLGLDCECIDKQALIAWLLDMR
ncbi:MAG: hypothetical protein OEZ58_19515 [Gammaproteobacteria bacterium]|nr:hypothetical protein [Gammaproteobacteria bacterium]